MKTALLSRLSDEQVLKLGNYVKDREAYLRDHDMSGWRALLGIAHCYAHDDLSPRVPERPRGERIEREGSTIFELSNETVGLIRAGISFVTARTSEDLFGSDPWMAASQVGASDQPLAEQITQLLRFKLDAGQWAVRGREAVESTFHFGTTIYKSTWERRIEKTWTWKNRLVYKGQKQRAPAPDGTEMDVPVEVLTAGGEPVHHDDETVEVESGEPGDGSAEEAAERPTATAFAKDPTLILDDQQHEWQPYLVEQERVVYDRLGTRPIDWRSWRCPLACETIEEADFRGHVYDARYSELKRRVGEWDPKTEELFKKLKANDALPKSEDKQTGPAAMSGTGDPDNPVIQCIDAEIDWDPEGNGDTVSIFVTVALQTGDVLFADYLCNMQLEGESHFSAVAIHRNYKRWAGRGWWQLYDRLQTAIDLHFNAATYRNEMAANPLAGTQPDAIEEDLGTLELVPGFKVTLKPGKTLQDFVQFMEIPNADQGTWQVINFMVTLFQLETGVTNAAQGSLGEYRGTETATGTQSVLASGSTLHKRPAVEMREGFEVVLRKDAELIVLNQNAAETVTLGEGQNMLVATLTPEQVRSLPLDVKLSMTRFQERTQVEQGLAAIAAFERFWALPPQAQVNGRELWVQVLKGQGIRNVDRILPPVMLAPTPAPGGQEEGGEGAPGNVVALPSDGSADAMLEAPAAAP